MNKIKIILVILFVMLFASTVSFIGCKEPETIVETVTETVIETVTETVVETVTEEAPEIETVRMGVLPYLDYQSFIGSDALGLDKELGINLEFIPFPTEAAGIRGLVTGALDVCQGSVNVLPPVILETPELKTWLTVCQFLGFTIIGREGESETFEDLLEEYGDPDAAQEAAFAQMEGKTFAINEASYGGFIASVLENAGLTLDDVKILNYPDDARAAAAFIVGEGDYYTGALPQQLKLLNDEEGFVAIVKHGQMGPAGLWYSNNFAMDYYIENNEETLLKIAAIHYRTMEYLKEKPEQVLPGMIDHLNKQAATSMTLDEAMVAIDQNIGFYTLEETLEGPLNPNSLLYWKLSVDYYIAAAEDDGKIEEGSVNTDDFVIMKQMIDKLTQNEELMSWINSEIN